jgi:VCBS repeat-containing protein
VANDDTASVSQGGDVDIDVLANDSDPDGDSLTITEFSNGNYGTVTQNPDGTLKYTHDNSETTSDSFTYTVSDGNGRSDSAIVTITVTSDPEPGEDNAKTAGSGWLATVENGKKINFGFNVQETGSGFSGDLQLNDKSGNVKIHFDEITAIGQVNGNCGSVPTGSNAVEFLGSGSYNDESATFRVCVQDNDEPGKGSDLFYLECITGCDYNTSSRTLDDVIDGGNIQVQQGASGTQTSGGGASENGSSGGGSTHASASTIRLNPVLLSSGVPGQLQLFTVVAYDENQDVLANAAITLTRTNANGTVQTFNGVTDAAGVLTFSTLNLTQVSEYIATSGVVESNTVQVSPITALP